MSHSSENFADYLNTVSRETLIDILENSFTEITVADKNGYVIYANPNSLRYHGMSPEEMCKLNFYTCFNGLWTPPSTDYAIEQRRTVFARQRYLVSGETHITITTPLFDDDGQVRMIVYNSTPEKPIQNFDLDCDEGLSPEKPASDREAAKESNNIVGRSYNLYATLNKLNKGAKSDIPILLLGESGVGKSLFAKYIHDASLRCNRPFISINCASIPDNLIESELFGYVPYAFTGASPRGKKGLVEMADGGTLFLDEIGELQPNIQVKLLDFLENQRFTSVGGLESKTVDTRIITATNKDLERLVSENKFREDLFWRINGITQTIPSLKKRKSDILPIAQYYLDRHNKKYGKDKLFSNEVIDIMLHYDWPGNVRQLKNAVEYMAVMNMGNLITADKLPEQLLSFAETSVDHKRTAVFDDMVEDYKKEIIQNYFNHAESVAEMAELLGLSQATAYRLVKKYIAKGEE
ncbi:MAG: sigma 54-interacting transcriptional regulator [Eubacterium sp.]|nr:sigma 54-interacting transcriptional regulator [Eubacterium sp.]